MSRQKTDPHFRAKYIEREMSKYLAEENIEINMDGLEETIRQYFRHSEESIDELFELTKDLNLWSSHFLGLLGLISLKKENYILEMESKKALLNNANSDEYLKNEISQFSMRIKQIRLFEKNMLKYIKFLSMAFYSVRRTYIKSMKVVIYHT